LSIYLVQRQPEPSQSLGRSERSDENADADQERPNPGKDVEH
jgi:hypothetical protein